MFFRVCWVMLGVVLFLSNLGLVKFFFNIFGLLCSNFYFSCRSVFICIYVLYVMDGIVVDFVVMGVYDVEMYFCF